MGKCMKPAFLELNDGLHVTYTSEDLELLHQWTPAPLPPTDADKKPEPPVRSLEQLKAEAKRCTKCYKLDQHFDRLKQIQSQSIWHKQQDTKGAPELIREYVEKYKDELTHEVMHYRKPFKGSAFEKYCRHPECKIEYAPKVEIDTRSLEDQR